MAIQFSSEAPSDGRQTIAAYLARGMRVPTPAGPRQPTRIGLRISRAIRGYALDLEAAEAGELAAARPGLWRYLLFEADEVCCELHLESSDAGSSIISVAHGPTTSGAVEAVALAAGLDAVSTRDFEPRVLLVPSVVLVAVWLRALDGGEDILIPVPPSQADWPRYAPIAPGAAAARLSAAAVELRARIAAAPEDSAGSGEGAPPSGVVGPAGGPSLEPLSLTELELEAAPGEGPVAQLLPHFMQQQDQSNWCWSAVGTSVGLYFETGAWTQCETASALLERDCCCGDHSCNEYGYLERALEHTNSLGSWIGREPMTLERVKDKLDADTPVCTRVAWDRGGAHYMAITGYQDERELWVQDPTFGTTSIAYDSYPARYWGGGAWTHTYTCARPEPSS